MSEKTKRQRILTQLVKDNHVASQEELSLLMERNGILVTQATLSRDIRELRISKVHGEGGYFYRLPARSPRPNPSDGGQMAASIESLEFSGPVAVLRTRPGHASMVASVVDGMSLAEIMGTLAGDDTILLVIREGHSRDEVQKALSGIFPGLGEKRIG